MGIVTEAGLVPRYKEGRRTLMSWRAPEYKVAVTLAWYFFNIRRVRDRAALLDAVSSAYADATDAILGKRTSWHELCADAEVRFGTGITAHKLLQRADKSARYGEHVELRQTVIEFVRARRAA